MLTTGATGVVVVVVSVCGTVATVEHVVAVNDVVSQLLLVLCSRGRCAWRRIGIVGGYDERGCVRWHVRHDKRR